MLACSHVVLATRDVARMLRFLHDAFGLAPRFANDDFGECVLPSGFRVAVFRVVGKAAEYFSADGERGALALGVTVADVDAAWQRVRPGIEAGELRASGAPKDHPWGERSFLLIDPDGNRWEVTQAPRADGMLADR